ncbi:MAG: TonB-dependent receptor, partial [Pseudohongiellaceae bacterium]
MHLSTSRHALPRFSVLCFALTASALSQAQQAGAIEEVVVFGRSTDLRGQANAATEGTVGGADLLIRPMVKTAELLEAMPGMVAVQHSGSGKANQYFLRGFNVDHGTDYSAHLDGVTLNLRSHGHGQGYLDVNGLIPEIVDGIDYRKGPYRADIGDFSLAGASFIRTIERLNRSFVSAEAGRFGWNRYAAGVSEELGQGTMTLVGEYKQYDGPWQTPEQLDHLSLWGKYTQQTSFGSAALTLSAYDAQWNPTEQIPERAIGTAACADAFCALDPTADGQTQRVILTGSLNGDDWDATLYAQHYDWDMKSNPTYDFQINQFDKRWIVGGKASRTVIDTGTLQLLVGGEGRYDDATSVGVDHYEAGRFIENISDNEIKEGSIALYSEATWFLSDTLRLLGGLRADNYDFDVTANSPGSAAGQTTDAQVSPKAGLAWEATDAVELYANWGRGFHSNDARGVVNRVDPVPGLSRGEGHEFGARSTLGDLILTASYWWLDQASELIFVGDSNSVEAKGGSAREGAEITAFWKPLEWLGIDASYNESRARYVDNPDGDYVEGAIEQAAQFGIAATRDDWDASLRVRYLGPYALVADNSDRADPLVTVSLRTARHWSAFTVYAEVINLLDSDRKEIVYNYEAFVPGLDPVGSSSADIDCATTNCRVSRVTEPRSFRMGVSYRF